MILSFSLVHLVQLVHTASAAAAGGGCGPNPWLAFTSHTSRSSCHFFTSFGVGGHHFNHLVQILQTAEQNQHQSALISINLHSILKNKTLYTGTNAQNLNEWSENSKCLCNIIGRHGVKSSCRTYQTQQYALIMTQSLLLN